MQAFILFFLKLFEEAVNMSFDRFFKSWSTWIFLEVVNLIFLRPGQLEFVHGYYGHCGRSLQNRFRAVFVATWAILPELWEIAFSAFLEPSARSISLQSEPDRRDWNRRVAFAVTPTFSQYLTIDIHIALVTSVLIPVIIRVVLPSGRRWAGSPIE